MLKRIGQGWWLPLLVLLLALPALQPLWQPGLQQTDDGMHHLFRSFNLDLAWRAGHAGTRWLAAEGFGYGFPVLNYYAPLGYYPVLLLHWLGAGFVSSLELTLALGLLLSALAMYAFARELLGPAGGAVAGVAYTWAPYHLADAWTRGALAELLAFVWLPLLMLAMLRIARSVAVARAEPAPPRRRLEPAGPLAPSLWGGACLAGLVFTHNLTVLLAAPVLAGWACLLLFAVGCTARERWLILRQYALMGLLGVVLSAVFWLPAIGESGYVRAGHVPEAFSAWVRRLERPDYLLAESWVHRYTIPQGRRIEHPLGLAQAAVGLLGLLAGAWSWRRLGKLLRLTLPLCAGLTLFALFMQSAWSRAVWQGIPGMLLLQFPWRWQTVDALALALASGYAGLLAGRVGLGKQSQPPVPTPRDGPAEAAWERRASTLPWAQGLQAGLVVLVALALMSGALPNLPWEPSRIPTTETLAQDGNVSLASLAMYDYGRGLWLREHGSDWMFEYMPGSVQVPREEFFLPATPGGTDEVPLDAQVVPGRQTPLVHEFQVSAASPWTLSLHQFDFPGWEARVDGVWQATRPRGPLGLAGVELPAGTHAVTVRFGSTPLRTAGLAATLLAALAGLLGMAQARRWRWLLCLLALGATWGGLWAYQLLAHPADYRPAVAQASFGGQIQLLGFYAPTGQLAPEQDSTVVLDWLALRQPATNYKVFLHLVDTSGKPWAGHDGEPGFYFSPTTRWQRGEVVEDVHTLEWQAVPPPGRYQLWVGLYDPATGARLPVLDGRGQPAADQVLLTEFEIRG